MSLNLNKSVSVGKYPNNEIAQGVYYLGSRSTTYKISPTASTDPFASKTNKFAESKFVRISAVGAAIHFRFGATAPTAVTTDAIVHANTSIVVAVDPTKKFLAIINTSGTPDAFVDELN